MKTDPALDRILQESLARCIEWVREHDYKAYEPADGNSSILFPLTGGRVWPMRVLQQVVLRSPFNIRPLLGIAPHESAIGRGYMAWTYLTMCRIDAPGDIRNEAAVCLKWLIDNRAPGFEDFCWGDPYEYATRGGRRPLGAPILIWTALIGQIFLEAHEVLGDDQYLRVAESVGRWVKHLPIEHTECGSCLSYNAYKQSSIHNSNAMGAAFLARLGALTRDEAAMSLAEQAMTYTCARQRSDGAWFYGEQPKYHWVDNFHTGYNISALKIYRDSFGDTAFAAEYERGIEYFKTRFFEPDGRPKYFDDQTYPIDIQCASQAIDTLVLVSNDDCDALSLAGRVALWTIRHMQERDGHFSYRQLPWITVKTPMLHWAQGTMSKAIASLLRKLHERTGINEDHGDFSPSTALSPAMTL